LQNGGHHGHHQTNGGGHHGHHQTSDENMDWVPGT
jgi:hypothetical protein